MKKKITRNDVAELAGVSPAVVSYVINQTKFVSEEKTLAVKNAIKELRYRPNVYARSLKPINRCRLRLCVTICGIIGWIL